MGQLGSKTPRTDALLTKWDDDGATRGAAFIQMRDHARDLEIESNGLREAGKRIIASEMQRTREVIDLRDDLVKALQGLLFAVRSNHPGGSPKTADEIFAEAGHAAIDALLKAGAE